MMRPGVQSPAPGWTPASGGTSGIVLWWAVGLAGATFLSRLPFRSTQLFAWDSANFALALQHYNVAWHQPQPPGYILYVAAARLLHFFVPDANAAYVWLSVGASAAAVLCTVLLGSRLFGAFVGVLGGLVLATSSLFWGQGEVAYPYAFLSLFTTLIVLLVVQSRWGRRDASLLTAAVLALAGGFRPELVPFLLPLWLFGAWHRPKWRWAVSGLLAAGLCAAWYIPMIQLSGGWTTYQEASGGYFLYFLRSTSGFGKLLLGVLENTRTLVGYAYNGLGLALLPIIYVGGRFFAPPRLARDHRAQVLALWIAPPLAFYLLIHIGNPGYLLSFLPALCLLAAHGTRVFADDLVEAAGLVWGKGADGLPRIPVESALWTTAALVASIALTNAGLFLTASGEGRLREIRAIDRILSRQVASIQASFSAEQTILLAYDRSRQLRYYLPQHRIELLFPEPVVGHGYDPTRYWEKRRVLQVPAGVQYVLLPDLGQNRSEYPGPIRRLDLGDGVEMLVADVKAGDEVRYGYQYVAVLSPG